MARGLKDLSDKIETDFELPLDKLLDSHSQTLQTNEKSILKQNRDIHDKIRRAEGDARRYRSRDPEMLQQALMTISTHTNELDALRNTHLEAIANVEMARIRGVKELFGDGVSRSAERSLESFRLGGELKKAEEVKEEVDVDTAVATGNFGPALRLSLGGPLLGIADRNDSKIPFYLTNPPSKTSGSPPRNANRRRGSLDSLTDSNNILLNRHGADPLCRMLLVDS
ncbi:hypothetical protein BC829DRAFT_399270 [Chytridium lagenaria]|nr:hypothetical protein BC829DRAFT_399270 [Chytridium lagenaria]